MSFPGGRNLEGLGGPIRTDRPNLANIDPTLDSCCQREEESARIGSALRRTLQRFDVVAEKERRRRHLVRTTVSSSAFDGCRCCYDPNSDGGEYRALIELRTQREQQKSPEETVNEVEEEKEKKGQSEDEGSDDEFDYLLDENLPGGEELKAVEELRRAELEWALLLREISLQHGLGVHRQMHPTRVLKAAGLASRDPTPGVVLHLVDPDSIGSASLDLYLEKLAETNKGTKFLRAGGRSTLLMDAALATKALPPLKPDSDMPALIAIRDGIAVNACPRLQGLTCSNGEIDPGAVYEWLDRSGVLLERAPPLDAMCRIRPEEEALMDYMLTSKPPVPPDEERYDCGLEGCFKSFPHQHVGEKNEKQDGLVISQDKILSEPDE